MTMFTSTVFLLCSVQIAFATTVVPQLVKGCVVNGHTYHVGESYSPSPCEHCFCSGSGFPACAIADCAPPMCVDAVRDPTKCCQTCPNGLNCKAHDGTIIKKGEKYNPTPDETCECPHNSFMFGVPLAICVVKVTHTLPAIHVDPVHVQPLQEVS